MPELPEVETTLRGISPHIDTRTILGATVRNKNLRWPVTEDLELLLAGRKIIGCRRRGKYLLLDFDAGHLLIHLGMSGSLRLVDPDLLPGRHDHVDIMLDSAKLLRFTDPRRFGAVLWLAGDPLQHSLLAGLGPEPLTADFSGAYLYCRSRGKSQCVKSFIMDSRMVVGVGNIYAAEALFGSGIHPQKTAGRISLARYDRLAASVVRVLSAAIDHGGTTLRNFVDGQGKPGYFRQELFVYGREGQLCRQCGSCLSGIRIANRATVFCRQCQR